MQSDEPLCPKALLSGYTVDGSFQQYAIGKAAHVARIPKECDLAGVAPVLCAGITVYKGLKESGAKPGQTVAIVGAGESTEYPHTLMNCRSAFLQVVDSVRWLNNMPRLWA